ncbi:hypothetical protein [Sphingobium nicotianae]|uniref:Uncharacterized protein n=1 Tax=Sphingobium nicotianae TaxID=2782607 RepID=A0A9X1ISY3_9SPHN|nr:hypothetical protein [Sphingobium nicotianae]MBT2188714.1 hypothetical protein [Sphingobium nicotianae]
MIARPGSSGRGIWQVRLAAIIVLCACALSLAYWPGLVTYDSVRQYDQALSGAFDDWHPPMMEAIWRLAVPVWPSPAPMLLLQLGLYGAGFLAMIGWAARRGRPRLALGFALCALLPLGVALMGEVLKDCLMAGALLLAAALALPGIEGGRLPGRLVAVVLVLFAATLRFNAFAAGLPILLAAAGPVLRATWPRFGLTALASLLALLSAMPIANAALGAEKSDVELSLVIFDLAGITEHSGQNAFAPLGLADAPVAVHRCYTPVKWDSFSWWVDPICPLNFERVRQALHARGFGAYGLLARAIAQHPFAYAQHRLAHFNISTRFWVTDEVERPVQRVSAPNDWGFIVPQGNPADAIDATVLASNGTPLGWPCVWIALAGGILLVTHRLRSAGALWMLAGSAFLYGMGYGLFGVAAELRYYLWTLIAVALAIAIVFADLPALSGARRWSTLAIMLAPALLIALAALAARTGAL